MADDRTPRRWTRALITGASAGLGTEFARTLAAEGTSLVLVARRGDRLTTLAAQLESEHGVEADVLPADLTVAGDIANVVARLGGDVGGPIDLLINNAGYGGYGDVADLDVDGQTGMVELNVRALTQLAHAAATTMASRGSGTILNVSSLAGFQPIPSHAVYAASKAYVTSLTEALATELRGLGVTVTALCPGYTRTEFHLTADVDVAAVPDRLWMEAGPVVQAGLDAAAAGRVVCVPGGLNRTTAQATGMLPSSLTRKLSARVADRF